MVEVVEAVDAEVGVEEYLEAAQRGVSLTKWREAVRRPLLARTWLDGRSVGASHAELVGVEWEGECALSLWDYVEGRQRGWGHQALLDACGGRHGVTYGEYTNARESGICEGELAQVGGGSRAMTEYLWARHNMELSHGQACEEVVFNGAVAPLYRSVVRTAYCEYRIAGMGHREAVGALAVTG